MTSFSRTIFLPLVFAALLATFFGMRVYPSFERIRVPLIEAPAPAAQGEVRLAFRRPRMAFGVQLLVMQIRNSDSRTVSLHASINGGAEHELQVPPESEKTYWLELRKAGPLQRNNHVVIRSNQSEWMIERAWLSNVYGSSTRLIQYVVVDGDAAHAEGIGIVWCALLGAFAFFAVAATHGRLRAIQAYVMVVPAAIFAIALVLPFFSRFLVLFSVRTFLIAVALMLLPGAVALYRELCSAAEIVRPGGSRVIQIAVVALLVFFFHYFSLRHAVQKSDGDYSALLSLSTKYVENNPLLRGEVEAKRTITISKGYGYDAQFYYLIAFDPWLSRFADRPRLYRRAIDAAPYRYARIGYPLLTRVVSGGDPVVFPKTMIWIILASTAIASILLALIAMHFKHSPYWAALLPLIPAFTVSLNQGLPEPVAAAFVLGGLLSYFKKRFVVSTVLLACAVLIRETSSLVVLVLAIDQLRSGRNVRAAALIGLSLLPYLCWRLFIAWKLFPVFGWKSVLFFSGGGLGIPFVGIIDTYMNIARGQYYEEFVAGAAIFHLFLASLFILSIYFLYRRRNVSTVVFFAFSLVAVSLNYEKVFLFVRNAERVTFDCFLFSLIACLSMGTTGKARFWVLILFAGLFFYDFFFMSMAGIFRAAMLL